MYDDNMLNDTNNSINNYNYNYCYKFHKTILTWLNIMQLLKGNFIVRFDSHESFTLN